MSTREAMQLALDALELEKKLYFDISNEAENAIAVLKAELEKPEPEPAAWMTENVTHPTIGRMLTFAPVEGWHKSWNAVPLYRKEDVL